VDPLPRPVTSWLQQLSDAPETDPDYWIEFRDGRFDTLRLSDQGPVEHEERRARQVAVDFRDRHGELTREVAWTIDLTKWASGASPDQFLLHWTDTDPTATRTTQLHFLTGVPADIAYRPGRVRYLLTPVRENAFRCQQAATRALAKASENKPTREFRSDLWLCEELPFGMAQITFSLTEYPQNLLVERTIWTVSAFGKETSDNQD